MTAIAPPAPLPRAAAEPGATGERFGALGRDLVRFAAVGFANTALFLAVYLLFRTILPAAAANVPATVLTTLTGTSANGRVTFGVAGAIGWRRHTKGMAVTALGLAVTTGAVSLVADEDNALGELAVLVLASAVAGLLRFALLRHWVFAQPPTVSRTVGVSPSANSSDRRTAAFTGTM